VTSGESSVERPYLLHRKRSISRRRYLLSSDSEATTTKRGDAKSSSDSSSPIKPSAPPSSPYRPLRYRRFCADTSDEESDAKTGAPKARQVTYRPNASNASLTVKIHNDRMSISSGIMSDDEPPRKISITDSSSSSTTVSLITY
jgi:hypothetical protein